MPRALWLLVLGVMLVGVVSGRSLQADETDPRLQFGSKPLARTNSSDGPSARRPPLDTAKDITSENVVCIFNLLGSWVGVIATLWVGLVLRKIDSAAQQQAEHEKKEKECRAAQAAEERHQAAMKLLAERRKCATRREEMEVGQRLKHQWDKVGTSSGFIKLTRRLVGELPSFSDQVRHLYDCGRLLCRCRLILLIL